MKRLLCALWLALAFTYVWGYELVLQPTLCNPSEDSNVSSVYQITLTLDLSDVISDLDVTADDLAIIAVASARTKTYVSIYAEDDPSTVVARNSQSVNASVGDFKYGSNSVTIPFTGVSEDSPCYLDAGKKYYVNVAVGALGVQTSDGTKYWFENSVEYPFYGPSIDNDAWWTSTPLSGDTYDKLESGIKVTISSDINESLDASDANITFASTNDEVQINPTITNAESTGFSISWDEGFLYKEGTYTFTVSGLKYTDSDATEQTLDDITLTYDISGELAKPIKTTASVYSQISDGVILALDGYTSNLTVAEGATAYLLDENENVVQSNLTISPYYLNYYIKVGMTLPSAGGNYTIVIPENSVIYDSYRLFAEITCELEVDNSEVPEYVYSPSPDTEDLYSLSEIAVTIDGISSHSLADADHAAENVKIEDALGNVSNATSFVKNADDTYTISFDEITTIGEVTVTIAAEVWKLNNTLSAAQTITYTIAEEPTNITITSVTVSNDTYADGAQITQLAASATFYLEIEGENIPDDGLYVTYSFATNDISTTDTYTALQDWCADNNTTGRVATLTESGYECSFLTTYNVNVGKDKTVTMTANVHAKAGGMVLYTYEATWTGISEASFTYSMLTMDPEEGSDLGSACSVVNVTSTQALSSLEAYSPALFSKTSDSTEYLAEQVDYKVVMNSETDWDIVVKLSDDYIANCGGTVVLVLTAADEYGSDAIDASYLRLEYVYAPALVQASLAVTPAAGSVLSELGSFVVSHDTKDGLSGNFDRNWGVTDDAVLVDSDGNEVTLSQSVDGLTLTFDGEQPSEAGIYTLKIPTGFYVLEIGSSSTSTTYNSAPYEAVYGYAPITEVRDTTYVEVPADLVVVTYTVSADDNVITVANAQVEKGGVFTATVNVPDENWIVEVEGATIEDGTLTTEALSEDAEVTVTFTYDGEIVTTVDPESGLESVNWQGVEISVADGEITITGLDINDTAALYAINGVCLANGTAQSNFIKFTAPTSATYIVSIVHGDNRIAVKVKN